MAESKQAVSFDDIIQADRARRKNEQLANEIFGRAKKNKDASDRNNRSSSRTPSLASRMGVQKRSSSTTSVSSRPNPPSRPSSTSLASRTSRIQSALDSPTSTNQANIAKSGGLSIKGAAGPFIVVANNFAPGTTAADIESAVANDSTDSEGHNGLLSCRLTSTHRDPAVTAELVFSERTIADRVISIYHNQRADGRVLKLTLKPTSTKNPFNPNPQPNTSSAQDDDNDTEMASPDPPSATDRYNSSRSNEEAARTRSNEHRRAEPDIQDARYGFNSSARPNEPQKSPAPENESRRDDERERERSRSRSRDRERERDRDRERRDDNRDRRYDDRDRREGGYERRDDRRDDRDNRRPYESRPPYDSPRGGAGMGGRSSHYGNGVGMGPSGPRGNFGGGGGGYGGPGPGRGMYPDRPTGPRGGGGFGRGGYGRGRW